MPHQLPPPVILRVLIRRVTDPRHRCPKSLLTADIYHPGLAALSVAPPRRHGHTTGLVFEPPDAAKSARSLSFTTAAHPAANLWAFIIDPLAPLAAPSSPHRER